MQEQNFANVLLSVLFLREEAKKARHKFSALSLQGKAALETTNKALLGSDLSEYQRAALRALIAKGDGITREDVTSARIAGLEPILRLHPSNVLKGGKKVRQLRAQQSRILSLLAASGGALCPPNLGGSVGRALKALEARHLVVCVPHPTRKNAIAWQSTREAREWEEAGGFVASHRALTNVNVS